MGVGRRLISIVWQAIDPGAEVYRACRLTSERDKKAGTPKAKLFFRRADETGLSVGLTSRRAVRDIRPEGLFKMIARDVRSCEEPLHFAQDEPEHAEIQGMPIYQQDETTALRIANHLMRHARICPIPAA